MRIVAQSKQWTRELEKMRVFACVCDRFLECRQSLKTVQNTNTEEEQFINAIEIMKPCAFVPIV